MVKTIVASVCNIIPDLMEFQYCDILVQPTVFDCGVFYEIFFTSDAHG